MVEDISLYIDTETCGFVDNSRPILGPHQPMVLQVGAVLSYTNGRTIGTLSTMIRQDCWVGRKGEVTQRATDLHGMTIEDANTYGEAPDHVFHILRRWARVARWVVAHNIEFDLAILDNAVSQQNLPAIAWPSQFCTMVESASILQLPLEGNKWSIGPWRAPKLGMAYRHFAKKDLVNGHDALQDVYAVRLVHRGILKHREGSPPPSA